ncbi:MAG: hypothetical protein V8S12_01350 [Lachnospiraceae bacterium]
MEEQLMIAALVAVFLAGAAGVILYQKAKEKPVALPEDPKYLREMAGARIRIR